MQFWHNHSTVRKNAAKDLRKAYYWVYVTLPIIPKAVLWNRFLSLKCTIASDLPLITNVCFQRKKKNTVSSRDVTGGSWVVPSSKEHRAGDVTYTLGRQVLPRPKEDALDCPQGTEGVGSSFQVESNFRARETLLLREPELDLRVTIPREPHGN